MLTDYEIKRKVWEEEYEKVCKTLAMLEFQWEAVSLEDENAQIGEKTVSSVGNMKGKIKITAKEYKKDLEKELQQKNGMKKALEKLLSI